MLVKIIYPHLINHLILILVIIVLSANIRSNEITKQNTIEIENEAKHLSKIWKIEKVKRSAILFEKAAYNWQQLDNLKKHSSCLREAAKLYLTMAKLNQMEDALEESLSVDKRINNFEGQVFSYSLLSKLYEKKGELDKSQTYYERALALSKKTSDFSKAFALLTAAEIEFIKYKLDESYKLLEVAIKLTENFDNPNLKANIMLQMAVIDGAQMHIEKALEKINRVASIWKDSNNKKGIALVHNAYGFVYLLAGEKQKSLDNYMLAQSMFPDDLDYFERVTSITGISALNIEFGRYKLAENNLRVALDILESNQNEYGQINVITPLARLIYLRGDHQQSRNLYEKGLRLATKRNDILFRAELFEQSAHIDFDEGKYSQALKNFTQAERIYGQIGLPFPRIQNSIAKVYIKNGDFEKARKLLTLSADSNKKMNDLINLADNLYYLAKISKENGNLKQALKESTEALEITDSLFYDVGNNNMRMSYHSSKFEFYDQHINILLQLHKKFPDEDYALIALQKNEKYKSRLMRERLQLTNNKLTLDADPKMVKEENDLIDSVIIKKEALTNEINKKEKKDVTQIKQLQNDILLLNDKIEHLRAEQKINSPIYAEINTSSDFKVKQFQDQILDDKTVLLEFFFGIEESYVWAISNNKTEVFYLPNADLLNARIERILELLKFNEKNLNSNVTEYQEFKKKIIDEYSKEANELSQILFKQIEKEIKGKNLLVVPDGKLQYLPISALPSPIEKNNTPLLITNNITYQPSASMLTLLKKRIDKKKPPKKDFLIFSDPIFSFDDKRLTNNPAKNNISSLSKDDIRSIKSDDKQQNTNNLKRLFGSKAEAEMIVNNFGNNNSKLITGFEANRNNFINSKINQYKVLHLATHGLFDKEFPQLSGIMLSQMDEKGNNLNGFVGLEDIDRLNLTADLVVLSACDTGNGEDIKGEGLQNMTNVFLQVGADSVISSRWKVDDQATFELMENFYSIWASENISASEALQKAKIKLSQNPNYQFPYYWASFTIHGDFENKTTIKPKSNNNSKYYIIIFTAFLLFLFFFRKKLQKILFTSR